MVNLGYVIAVGLLGWVAAVHAARLIRQRRNASVNDGHAEGAPVVGYN
jgi:hypothetical protein